MILVTDGAQELQMILIKTARRLKDGEIRTREYRTDVDSQFYSTLKCAWSLLGEGDEALNLPKWQAAVFMKLQNNRDSICQLGR